MMHEIFQNKKFNVIREISYCMPVKPDLSCKICGTHELFVALYMKSTVLDKMD